ncbi:MAG: MarR family transcriptional regulator [Pararhodobacter sp.]|nr:MarR family transcriptional regulator [Pararhodobacter sp.]
MGLTFGVMTEIGIIAQLSAAAFDAAMPGWSVAHFGVVMHLIRRGDGVTPLELARAFQQPKTTMTHTLQVLEKRGLITMTPNPRDGRSKLVHLTDAGRAWQGQAMAQVARHQAALHQRLNPGTLAVLAPHLAHLRAVMDAMRDEN